MPPRDKVGTGPEVLSSTMPWGINPPRGHPILAARLDEVALAMVVREASGRRRDIASTTGSSQGVRGSRGREVIKRATVVEPITARVVYHVFTIYVAVHFVFVYLYVGLHAIRYCMHCAVK